jgi:hypothetical protein
MTTGLTIISIVVPVIAAIIGAVWRINADRAKADEAHKLERQKAHHELELSLQKTIAGMTTEIEVVKEAVRPHAGQFVKIDETLLDHEQRLTMVEAAAATNKTDNERVDRELAAIRGRVK